MSRRRSFLSLFILALVAACGVGCGGNDEPPPDEAPVDKEDPGEDDTGGDDDPDEPQDPCVPTCVGRECGGDGCGGSCGACTDLAAPFCDELAGQCVESCTPKCAGKNCGSDGCGGSCGTCVGSLECSDAGICTPPDWTCDPVRYAAQDQCDCECGAFDPDCEDTTLGTAGCAATERCAADGQCSPIAPAAWQCPANRYGARDACDCGCGAVDPDCEIEGLPLRGCTGRNATCTEDATCACTPNCGSNVCGDDGCGGSCGTCSDPEKSICNGGQCVSACEPAPIRCNFAECGADACGGSCGTCGPGETCIDGACETLEVSDPLSCFGRCGNLNPAGCSCAADCVADGSCCPDYDSTCGSCIPSCGDKVCGPDGCGGSCGSCGDDAVCSAGVCITGCQPDCDGRQCGDDGCGGVCGTCGLEESCAWTGKCVPDTWFCDSSLYADGTACHCGCGAYDPNCDSTDIVFGCATSGSTCSAAGICSDATCAADTECGAGRLCAGTYYQGDARFSGVCATSLGGREVGELCEFGGACATGICAGGLCRSACGTDEDCAGEQICVAMPQRDLAGGIKGFVDVCELLPARFGTCSAQADCPEQACVAVLEATTLAPRYTCATVSGALGASCDAAPCPVGQLCVQAGANSVCTLPCPAGHVDCPNGWQCGEKTYASESFESSSSAPTIPVCLPN